MTDTTPSAAAKAASDPSHTHDHGDDCGCGHDHHHHHHGHHHHAPVVTYQRGTPKVGRNDACPCGSGKKYKKCCLAQESA
jgi:uncharacterized protein